MKKWKCTAREVIYHEWEVEAETKEEAEEEAGTGCPNDCETDGQADFGDITVEEVSKGKEARPKS